MNKILRTNATPISVIKVDAIINLPISVFDKLVSLKFERPTTFEVKPLSLFLTGDVKENPVVDDKPITPTLV